MMAGRVRGAFLLALVAFVASGAIAAGGPKERWVAAWATSQQIPEDRNTLPAADLKDATLRQIVRIQIGGDKLRVRLTNAFGTAPLRIGGATIARSVDNASSKIDFKSDLPLTFAAKLDVVIPAGGEYWSDPVPMSVAAGTDLAISLYLPEAPAQQTSHPGSRATSWYAHGNQSAFAELAGAKSIDHWYQIAGIEVVSAKASAVVVMGDSITDGSGVKPNTNLRWPDALQKRMRGAKGLADMAVLNAGIGGNRLLLDGLGPNAIARFDREVLSPPGVTHLIVLEGVNDLGVFTRDAPQTAAAHAAHVEEMLDALRQIIARAHARGILVIGGTITPFAGSAYYHPDAMTEADRQIVNTWIRAGVFDAYVDFDAALRDPAHPERLRADLDSGDGLHPSIAGYQAMADAVPLALLGPRAKWPKAIRAAPQTEPAPMLAFTFDDMPAHSALPSNTTRIEIGNRIIAALKAGGAPAFGFVNGVLIDREPASAPVLGAWRKAGLPLGNHGWSHANLGEISDDQFVAELTRNEPLLAARMGTEDWHWFRYPFLAEASNDPARRARIRGLLAAHGYKVAPVTMNFDDWAYNDVYARCVGKGDNAAIAALEMDWLDAAAVNISRYREMSHKLFGRDIPYVILMHLGALDAEMLPKLIDLYKSRGFRFVSLAEATRDPYYADEVNPALPPEPQGLEGRMIAKGLPIPTGYSRPALDSMCR
jgi:lysophospholipase L1-like esterase/peptidoglycan/xylan/chitin deacetylase (PgdA/CDA1 family)